MGRSAQQGLALPHDQKEWDKGHFGGEALLPPPLAVEHEANDGAKESQSVGPPLLALVGESRSGVLGRERKPGGWLSASIAM